MKALIFGANGQDGHYLSAACRKRQIEVIGISRTGPWLRGDVSSPQFVREIIQFHHPEIVFHLAARSTTAHAALLENHATVGSGTLNILESVKQYSSPTKVFITGSGVQFINSGKPISETDPFDHCSAYATVRNYSVFLARYFRGLGIQTYVGYLFHHESPLRGEHHISQKIARAAIRIAQGSDEALELGNISVVKEWSYAEDIAEGIMTLIEQNQVSEAVIGSGCGYSIEDWLSKCFRLINKDWRRYVHEKKDYQPEYRFLVSNPETINSLGWKTKTTIDELAEIMVSPRHRP